MLSQCFQALTSAPRGDRIFAINDLYVYMMMNRKTREDIHRITTHYVFAADLQTYVLSRIHILYRDRSEIDLMTSYHQRYRGEQELCHQIKFEELTMYYKLPVASMNVRAGDSSIGHCPGRGV